MAEAEDDLLIAGWRAGWRDLIDFILVLVSLSILYDGPLLIRCQDGLFAAFIFAFLVFTVPQLQPNSTDIAMDVLIHISQRLSNSTIPAYVPTKFTVSPSIATANALFFLSFGFVLTDAFLAVLMRNWTHEINRSLSKYTVARFRAEVRAQRLQGLERWKFNELVALLPILLQTSLLLFWIGLVVLLFPIHLISAIFASLPLAAALTFFAFATYTEIVDDHTPFSSPASRGLVRLIKMLNFRILNISSLPRRGRVTHSPSPQGSRPVNKQAAVHQFSLIERMVTTTAPRLENIPVLLELLDQPVKDFTLRPSNVNSLKYLLQNTLGLLGDSSTLSDPAARTIARTMVFCYDNSKYADERLSGKLKYHFGHLLLGQTDKKKPLNSLFASYMDYYCGSPSYSLQDVNSTIAYLEPSSAADMELLWMVNTIHKNLQWKKHQHMVYDLSLDFFAAVLTYVSSTEQSRRSQVPLTAAVIYAMHTIRSALTTKGIGSIDGDYLIRSTVLNTFGSFSVDTATCPWTRGTTCPETSISKNQKNSGEL